MLRAARQPVRLIRWHEVALIEAQDGAQTCLAHYFEVALLHFRHLRLEGRRELGAHGGWD